MDRSTTNVNDNCSSHDWTTKMYVCTTWNSWNLGIGQWSTVYVRRVCSILPQEWHTSRVSDTLSPIVKWACRDSGAVQTIKNGIRKMEEGNLQLKLSRVLLNYRITPQSTTGKSPAELLMNRQLRSCLNLLQPSLTQRVEKKQAYQKSNHDKQAQERSFEEGEEVYVKNYGQYGQRWLKVMLSLWEDQCQHW